MESVRLHTKSWIARLPLRLGLGLLLFFWWGNLPALARVSGNCSDCHSMHYSQGGQVLPEWGSGGPYSALLSTDCVGCHTGVNSGGVTPFVLSITPPIYSATGTEAGTNTLAGGNFYWVAGDDENKGHNVIGLAGADSLTTPPGYVSPEAAADGSTPGNGSWPAGQQVTCAGLYGCHGTHSESVMTAAIAGGHHSGLSGALTTPGTSPATGFRMLVGIAGYEDPDWELTPTLTAHNQYKGVDGGPLDDSTISSFCLRCHDNYHGTDSGSGWLRHPTDYDMGNASAGSELRNYGGGTNQYSLAVPVASLDVSSVISTVTFADDSIVTCLSCHRSHGSPYAKLLRWDYTGGIGAGCTVCHTSKD